MSFSLPSFLLNTELLAWEWKLPASSISELQIPMIISQIFTEHFKFFFFFFFTEHLPIRGMVWVLAMSVTKTHISEALHSNGKDKIQVKGKLN